MSAKKLKSRSSGVTWKIYWADTVKFFQERDPEQIARANQNPKRKMALIFRWYLGLSSKWSNSGEAGREMDYQIWRSGDCPQRLDARHLPRGIKTATRWMWPVIY